MGRTSTQRSRDYDARKRKQGFVRLYIWTKPDKKERIKKYADRVNKE